MLRMLYLNWTAIKSYRLRGLLIPVCLLVTGWFSSIYLVPLAVFLLFSFSINVFAVEEKGNLDRVCLTLPVTRGQVVAGRYLFSFLLFLAGLLAGFSLMPLANLFSLSRWYPDWGWSLALLSFGFLLYALLGLFTYPALFGLGYMKGRIWGYYIPAIVVGLACIGVVEYDIMTGGTFIRDLLIAASEHILAVSGGILGLGVAVLTVSWLLSWKIYIRREV